MRLKTGLFVSALVRRVFSEGGMAVIERRGAEEAGAVFIRIRHRDGTESLAAPAPQTAFDTARPDARLFEFRAARAEGHDVSEAIARESRFDPDIWVVEIETDTPEAYLDFSES
ncbi:DUF1491 family protein [Hoeflea sp.]|uniref:DUF1491 family protein n=1 Tax=Hoeflea sp. TaxID=1940281 RepID=UPI003747C992